jgi:cytochrome b6-f complex iron-sulfur subunit
MSEPKKMSVAEILAAARSADGKGSPGAAETAVSDSTVPPLAAESLPAVAKPAAAKPTATGGRPSVSEILAQARAKGQSAGEKPAVATEKPGAVAAPSPAAKSTAKPAVARVTPAAGRGGVQRDTASVLAAARAATKPGPVSKAEAPDRPAPKPKPLIDKPAARPVPPKPIRVEKPAKPAGKADGEDRRSFLQIATGSFLAVGFTALSVTGGLFSLGLARFMFPNVLAEPPSKFKVGARDGFPSGKVETKYVSQYGVWVINSEVQGLQQIYALKTVCTHLGCTPSWLEAEQKFKCPCHGSGFYKDGVNFEGPAPRPLERYAIRIADDGQLEVDKSRTFHEELGQWADPESFVMV